MGDSPTYKSLNSIIWESLTSIDLDMTFFTKQFIFLSFLCSDFTFQGDTGVTGSKGEKGTPGFRGNAGVKVLR